MRIELTAAPDQARATRVPGGWTLTLEKAGTAKAQSKVSSNAEMAQTQTLRISTESLLVRPLTLTL